jgi:methionine-rich copper-binding protein CopC
MLSLTAIAIVALTGQAFAHAHLKSSTPADKAVIKASPAELDLTFTEKLNLNFSAITVKGVDGKPVTTDAATLGDEDTTLIVPVSTKLASGAYAVEWHVLSADGHKTKGKYSFTIKP